MISNIFGESIPLGAKLDDSSIALGTALSASASTSIAVNKSETSNEVEVEVEVESFTQDEIEDAKLRECKMQSLDSEIKGIVDARNDLEAFIFEMRAAPKRKYGNLIDSLALNAMMVIIKKIIKYIHKYCTLHTYTTTYTILSLLNIYLLLLLG